MGQSKNPYYEIIPKLQRVPQLSSKAQFIGFSHRHFLSLPQGLQGGKSTPSESSQEAYERLLEKLQTLMICRTYTFSGSKAHLLDFRLPQNHFRYFWGPSGVVEGLLLINSIPFIFDYVHECDKHNTQSI